MRSNEQEEVRGRWRGGDEEERRREEKGGDQDEVTGFKPRQPEGELKPTSIR